jgi:hypothetical protein
MDLMSLPALLYVPGSSIANQTKPKNKRVAKMQTKEQTCIENSEVVQKRAVNVIRRT